MARTITSANSVLLLTVPGVFPVPVQVEGFAADDAFTTDTVDSAETMMGVDGKMSAGYTPRITPMTVTLNPDSPSLSLFETWVGAQDVAREVFYAEGLVQFPSLQRSYVMHKGALRRLSPMPSAKKVLQPVQYQIDWELVQSAPLA